MWFVRWSVPPAVVGRTRDVPSGTIPRVCVGRRGRALAAGGVVHALRVRTQAVDKPWQDGSRRRRSTPRKSGAALSGSLQDGSDVHPAQR